MTDVSASVVRGDPRPGLTAPVRVLDVEATAQGEAIDDARPAGGRYTAAAVLVRVHGRPIGLLALPLPPGGLAAGSVAEAIDRELSGRIAAHLALDAATGIPAAGAVPGDGRPACEVERERELARAPELAVVVPTRDRPERVMACVRSILATGHPRLDVVVVDNARTSDATERAIRSAFAERPVRYVREDRPGSARARDRGLAASTADLVAFVDDDVLVDPGWALAVVGPFVDDPAVGCVTGTIVAAELETDAQVWIEEYGGFGKGFDRRAFDLTEHRAPDPLYPFAAGLFGSGATMAFRRDALLAFGGFDPALGGGTAARGGEDLAAFVETILAGRRLVYEPEALVRHFHHRDYERLRRVMFGYGTGLGAYLTATAVRHPRLVPGMLARAARAGRYVIDPRSPKNARKRAGYPAALTRLELAGLAYGPLAYARSRIEATRPGAGA